MSRTSRARRSPRPPAPTWRRSPRPATAGPRSRRWRGARQRSSGASTPRAGSTRSPASAAPAARRSPRTRCARLPVGVPKLMVSTVASGDTRPYVGAVDVTMMYSVVDIAGINRISERILSNAAGRDRRAWRRRPSRRRTDAKPLVGASMFGVTTPCVTAARERLEELGYEVLVFHQTGTGGQSMEELDRGGFVRRARRDDDRARRRARRRRLLGRPEPARGGRRARASRRSSRSARSTWSTSARSRRCPSGSAGGTCTSTTRRSR